MCSTVKRKFRMGPKGDDDLIAIIGQIRNTIRARSCKIAPCGRRRSAKRWAKESNQFTASYMNGDASILSCLKIFSNSATRSNASSLRVVSARG